MNDSTGTNTRQTPPATFRNDRVMLVRLSLTATDEVCGRLEQLLSAEERERARRRLPTVRRRAVVSRGRLRQLLGWVLNLPPAEVVLQTNQHGKPGLTGSLAGRCEFNVTHSGDEGLIAVAVDRPVGVDLEIGKPTQTVDWARLMAGTIFGEAEQARWQGVPDSQAAAAVLDAWVTKEAVFKAVGTGIGDRLRQCELPPVIPRVGLTAAAAPVDCQLVKVSPLGPASAAESGVGVTLLSLQPSWHVAVATTAARCRLWLTDFESVLRGDLPLR